MRRAAHRRDRSIDSALARVRTRRLQILGGSAAALAAIALLASALAFDPEVPFLTRRGPAEWITYPLPTLTNAIAIDRQNVPKLTFAKRFRLREPPAAAEVTGRALRGLELTLNGIPIVSRSSAAGGSGADQGWRGWKEPFHAQVGDALRSGTNELRAVVENPRGPALLELALEAEGLRVLTDASWEVALGGGAGGSVGTGTEVALPVAVASDRSINPEVLDLPTPADILTTHWPALAALFAAAALLYATVGRSPPAWARGRSAEIALALVVVYWVLLFALKLSRMPVMMGFDIPAHLLYIDTLIETHTLPLADDGGASYHPPLFHALTALLVSVSDVSREGASGRIVYRLVPFLAGLTSVCATWAIARRLWPERGAREPALAVGFAGLLPMNVYVSSYVSNEALHAACASAGLLGTSLLILGARRPRTALALTALALGFALLTKFTSLLLVPIAAFFLAARAWAAEGRGPASALAEPLALVAGVALIAGWFYVRSWLHFGSPVVGNWDDLGRLTWWEQPGFHTADYYLGFGESLRHPFFAGYHSFADGIYSTLWGDGLVAGMVSLSTRHPFWRYDFMTVGYWLALPATLLIGVGVALAAREALSGEDARRGLVLSLMLAVLAATLLALLYATLLLPYYAQAKAFYGLAALAPLSIAAAYGLAAVPRALPDAFWPVRALYYGWLGTLAGTLVLSFLA